ncbi:unnamed protein product [Dovyalis caffra]|uniref:Uncharacterized protein n=1 Tax=Dovyalis caffra TaxID=77055 RepID=A0AAV1SAT0_9ROSI|nr:unnamed protein product [Dovyalis caffra]
MDQGSFDGSLKGKASSGGCGGCWGLWLVKREERIRRVLARDDSFEGKASSGGYVGSMVAAEICSYAEGREAFKAQKQLQKHSIATSTDIGIPGSRFLPTLSNFKMWKLDSKVKNSVRHIKWRELSRSNVKEIRLREEVLSECGMGILESDMLTKLKSRGIKRYEITEFDGPKGVYTTIPFVTIQRSKEYWEEDANEFNPLSFKNGVSHAAKYRSALLAFGLEYKHAPANHLTSKPEYGLPIIVKPFLLSNDEFGNVDERADLENKIDCLDLPMES